MTNKLKQALTYTVSTFIVLLFTLILTGCGNSNNSDGPWASGNPDKTDTGPREPAATPAPTPTPAPTQPSSTAFALSSKTYTLAHDSAKIWNGCDATAAVKGGYNSDSSCGNAYVHPGFGEHLNDFFMSCIDKAAYDNNYPQPVRTFIRHMGSYNDRNARNSTSLSMHAYARALDVAAVRLFDVEGKLKVFDTNIMFYKESNAGFYDAFRECWRKTFPTCKSGQREYVGSIGHPDSDLGGNTLHNDHIHLSFPFCAG